MIAAIQTMVRHFAIIPITTMAQTALLHAKPVVRLAQEETTVAALLVQLDLLNTETPV